jgi:excinuclease UvrABC ATPase subunit
MRKTGRQRIRTEKCSQRMTKCANCGGEGVYKVTYEDMYGKLVVPLCEECDKLGYEQLKLQTQLDWPVTT